MKITTVLTILALAFLPTDVSVALVLCPSFPRCCATKSCWYLCPSCREAQNFKNGIRLEPLDGKPCPDTLRLIYPDPFAFPDEVPFPEEFFCIEWMKQRRSLSLTTAGGVASQLSEHHRKQDNTEDVSLCGIILLQINSVRMHFRWKHSWPLSFTYYQMINKNAILFLNEKAA